MALALYNFAMADFVFNTTDVALVGILLVSALLAFFRGLVHELLAIGKWIGALLVAFYGFDFLLPLISKVVPNDLAAQITTSIILFVGTLVILAYVSNEICDHIHESSVGNVDRSLGFIFGLFRGAVIVCLAFMLLTWLSGGVGALPKSIRTAKSAPYLKDGAYLLADVLNVRDVLDKPVKQKDDEEEAEEKAAKASPKKSTTNKKADTKTPQKKDAKDSTKATDKKSGYSDKQREKLDELIESTE